MSATSITLGSSGPSRRARDAFHARPVLAIAAVTLLVAWAGLMATRRPTAPTLSKSAAVAALKRDSGTAKLLRTMRWSTVRVTPMDRDHESVWLLDGGRLQLTAVVNSEGTIVAEAVPSRQSQVYGSNIASDWRVLAMLTLVFVLMTAVWPLWRLRNVDVLVAAGSVAGVVLLNEGFVDGMVMVSYPLLAYLAVRCAFRAFTAGRPAPPSVPLFDRLARHWPVVVQLRLLRVVTLAAALVMAMIGLSSLGVLDVGYAVAEGATAITHGLLPYGHIPDVLHGDTYPIGSYLLYVPFAALSPVHSEWDSADFTLLVAVIAALLTAFGLWRAVSGRRPAGGKRRADATRVAALRGVIAWLCFPPMVIAVSTGTTDVALAAIFVGALVLWRRPVAAVTVLAAGAWFKLSPVALMPLWLAPLRGRVLLRALAAIALVSAAMLAVLVGLGGAHGVSNMVHAMGYQQTRTSLDSLWTLIGSVPLQQLAQAATIALIVGGALQLRRDRRLRNDPARVAALSAAILLGLQISASYWSFLYLTWIMPFLVLSVLRSE